MALIGAHVSIAGGLYKAIERGDALQCESIQIFTTSSRTWKTSPCTEETVRDFREAFAKAKHVKRVIAHNSYLLNLSTADESLRKKSVEFFIGVMEQCEALGVESLITHPGSHLGAGVEAGIAATAKSLNEVLIACRGFQTKLLLENTAGQGACIGHELGQLASIRDKTKHPERFYYCFDTQHAFAAGYDLRTESGYEEVMEQFDHLLDLKRLAAFHLNDALKDFNCRVDRHEHIGKGYLGKEVFRCLMNDKRFENTPMCVETEPGENDVLIKKDLKTLRALRSTNLPKNRAKHRKLTYSELKS